MTFFKELEQLIIHIEPQKPWISKAILKEKNKDGGITL